MWWSHCKGLSEHVYNVVSGSLTVIQKDSNRSVSKGDPAITQGSERSSDVIFRQKGNVFTHVLSAKAVARR